MDEHGVWVYGIVEEGRVLPDGFSGVAPEAPPPALVAGGGVAAVASPVPLAGFGEEALQANLNDLGWLERVARAHDSVLEGLLADGPVVPLRVCTIYRDAAQVEAMLESRSGELAAAVARLGGKAEWGVKATADREQIERHARESSETARALAAEIDAKPAGAAYIARKRLAAIVRDEADALTSAALNEAHERLAARADAAVVLPAQNRELSGHRGEMVLNAAYLVDDDERDAFAQCVRELDSPGLEFTLTGPWPAYNFATGDRIEAPS